MPDQDQIASPTAAQVPSPPEPTFQLPEGNKQDQIPSPIAPQAPSPAEMALHELTLQLAEARKQVLDAEVNRLLGAIDGLKTRISALEKDVKTLEQDGAKKDGGYKATAFWAISTGAMLAIYLGYNTVWGIPNAVVSSVSKQVDVQIEKALPQEVSKQLPVAVSAETGKQLPDYVKAVVPLEIAKVVPDAVKAAVGQTATGQVLAAAEDAREKALKAATEAQSAAKEAVTARETAQRMQSFVVGSAKVGDMITPPFGRTTDWEVWITDGFADTSTNPRNAKIFGDVLDSLKQIKGITLSKKIYQIDPSPNDLMKYISELDERVEKSIALTSQVLGDLPASRYVAEVMPDEAGWLLVPRDISNEDKREGKRLDRNNPLATCGYVLVRRARRL